MTESLKPQLITITTMETIIRVPMRESFSYIEFKGTWGPEEAVALYKHAVALSKVGLQSANDF